LQIGRYADNADDPELKALAQQNLDALEAKGKLIAIETAHPTNPNLVVTTLVDRTAQLQRNKGAEGGNFVTGFDGTGREIIGVTTASSGKLTPKQVSDMKIVVAEANSALTKVQESTLILMGDPDKKIPADPSAVGPVGIARLWKDKMVSIVTNSTEETAPMRIRALAEIIKAQSWRALVGGGQLSKPDNELIDRVISTLSFTTSPAEAINALSEFNDWIVTKVTPLQAQLDQHAETQRQLTEDSRAIISGAPATATQTERTKPKSTYSNLWGG
jgi:hypothetical protein